MALPSKKEVCLALYKIWKHSTLTAGCGILAHCVELNLFQANTKEAIFFLGSFIEIRLMVLFDVIKYLFLNNFQYFS